MISWPSHKSTNNNTTIAKKITYRKSELHQHLKSTYVKDNINRKESNTVEGGKL